MHLILHVTYKPYQQIIHLIFKYVLINQTKTIAVFRWTIYFLAKALVRVKHKQTI